MQRRKDGYHELDTVFCHLDLHDDVHVTLRQGVIELESQTGLSVTEDLAGARLVISLQAELAMRSLRLRAAHRTHPGKEAAAQLGRAAAVLRLAEPVSAPPAGGHSAAQLAADVPSARQELRGRGGTGDDTPLAIALCIPPR